MTIIWFPRFHPGAKTLPIEAEYPERLEMLYNLKRGEFVDWPLPIKVARKRLDKHMQRLQIGLEYSALPSGGTRITRFW